MSHSAAAVISPHNKSLYWIVYIPARTYYDDITYKKIVPKTNRGYRLQIDFPYNSKIKCKRFVCIMQ